MWIARVLCEFLVGMTCLGTETTSGRSRESSAAAETYEGPRTSDVPCDCTNEKCEFLLERVRCRHGITTSTRPPKGRFAGTYGNGTSENSGTCDRHLQSRANPPGYGQANVEIGAPVKPETMFQSGFVRKQFVAAAIMMLVEDGKVSLDDSIAKYFPDAPAPWKLHSG